MSNEFDWAEATETQLLSAALGHVETLGWTPRLVAAAGDGCRHPWGWFAITPTTVVYAALRCDHDVELWIFTDVAPCSMHHGSFAAYHPSVAQLVHDGIAQPCSAATC